MPCNCTSTGLEEIFDDRMAAYEARRFRRKGPSIRSRKLLNGIRGAASINGAHTLEIGAGIGANTITLLREGAASASIIDAVPAYVAMARDLAGENGVADRLDITLADYVSMPHDDDAVDIVLMDRVICCHPRWPELLEPAARQARRVVAMTYPRASWWTRAGVATINFIQRLRGMTFRVHVHPPASMHEALRRHGFDPHVTGHWGPWEVMIAKRRAAAA